MKLRWQRHRAGLHHASAWRWQVKRVSRFDEHGGKWMAIDRARGVVRRFETLHEAKAWCQIVVDAEGRLADDG